ncbi:MAG TPA: hypothetical protein DCM54_02705 [Gammaproteobacteria bacterium]|nr:hypothetical protein [Gammaproteobacteria bacterium]|tara:strand:- start:3003 stop:3212 length:210 start_codon:yes stop_codon:yes gene_type:complete
MEYFSQEDAEYYQYLYDLQGYLVIENVLTEQQVAELNSLVEDNIPPLPENWEEEERLYKIYRFGMAGGS